ncbi:hypothetical protein B0H14DRAFT_2623632 [Mycena olivaceomarginata]|nr:hypothetical protein B0H14DRAFT_2623632 [Mycena olivaceomarginata]
MQWSLFSEDPSPSNSVPSRSSPPSARVWVESENEREGGQAFIWRLLTPLPPPPVHAHLASTALPHTKGKSYFSQFPGHWRRIPDEPHAFRKAWENGWHCHTQYGEFSDLWFHEQSSSGNFKQTALLMLRIVLGIICPFVAFNWLSISCHAF